MKNCHVDKCLICELPIDEESTFTAEKIKELRLLKLVNCYLSEDEINQVLSEGKCSEILGSKIGLSFVAPAANCYKCLTSSYC
jgi:hypothetical protein